MRGRTDSTPSLLRRLAWLPVSLLLLSLLAFALMQMAPGDPVARRLSSEGAPASRQDPQSYEREYRREAIRSDHHLPPFYFSITNASVPDTLHRVLQPDRRRCLRALASRYGNWPLVQQYYTVVRELAVSRAVGKEATVTAARKLLVRAQPDYIAYQLRQLDPAAGAELRRAFAAMVTGATPHRVLLPRFYWHGTDSRYHRFLTGLLRGDLGLSYRDRRPVFAKILQAMPGTLALNGLSLLLVYLIAVPLGLFMAYLRGSRFDRWSTAVTFLAFGIPGFWLATLLANFLTTPAFGLDYFPSMGFGEVPPGASAFTALRVRAAHLVLPVFCLTYPSLAYVSRHLRSATIRELGQPYVDTARMKGLAGTQVLWRHVFRNAAFPLITLFGGLLPALLAGSVLIEKIFNLPGMGLLLYDSVLASDWPTITALILLNGLLTVLGLVLADLAYALVDPRLRLGKSGRS